MKEKEQKLLSDQEDGLKTHLVFLKALNFKIREVRATDP